MILYYNHAKMLRSKHANLMYECITYYIYAYQLHCPKQDVLRTLIWVIVYIRHRSKAYIRVCIASKAVSVLLLAGDLAEF